jgi:hypothetical protein
LGAFWGLGHTLALLGVGIGVALAERALPERLAERFEFAVAMMLVFLGIRATARAVREGYDGSSTRHSHGTRAHDHHPHVHLARPVFAARPLGIGIVHGLAGSGALTAMVIGHLPSTASRLAYIGLFGLGSVLGMAILSGLLGWPLARVSQQPGTARMLGLASGLISTGLGVFWGYSEIVRWLP